MSGSGGGRGRRTRDTRTISGRISPPMYKAVLEVVESGLYVDVTDYLRDLIRRDLEARGIRLEARAEEDQPP